MAGPAIRGGIAMSGALDALIRGTIPVQRDGVAVSPPRGRLNVQAPLKALDDSVNAATAITVDVPALQLALQNNVLGSVPDWYVNTATGSDSNDGLTPSTAFASVEKLCSLLFPGGARLTISQDTTVHLAGGAYGRMQVNVSSATGAAFFFIILGTLSSSANITLATATASNQSGTRGRITTASGTFVDKKRIRDTSQDAVAFCAGLTSSTDAFVSGWTDNSVTTIDAAVSDVVVVDTLLTSFTDPLELEVRGQGGIIVQDVQCVNGGLVRTSEFQDSIQIYRCEIGGEWIGGCSFFASRFTLPTELQNGWFRFAGDAFQSNVTADRCCFVLIEGSNLTDGAAFILANGAQGQGIPGSGEPANTAWEFERGTGSITGIVVNPGCFLDITGYALWGVTGNYVVGIAIASCASLRYSTLPSIPSTTNATVAGTTKTWAALPFVDTTHLAGIVTG